MNSCRDCRFSAENTGAGECRFNPPTWSIMTSPGPLPSSPPRVIKQSGFPGTQPDAYCGEWKAKDNDAPVPLASVA